MSAAEVTGTFIRSTVLQVRGVCAEFWRPAC